jgi:hypothetical protein
VLAEPITAVRRTALVGQVGFLVDRIRGADPELAERFAGSLSRLRHESRRWSREPGRRLALLVATEHAASAIGSTVAADRGNRPLEGLAAGGGSNRTSLLDLSVQRPTTLAYHYFWLLDDLPAHAAGPLTREFTAATRWVLRNVLSGCYNRRAHLMWIGGGSGPAV